MFTEGAQLAKAVSSRALTRGYFIDAKSNSQNILKKDAEYKATATESFIHHDRCNRKLVKSVILIITSKNQKIKIFYRLKQ